jgi:hypothetical protein
MPGNESDDAEYDRIWKSIYPCVDKCLLSHFRNVQEMLHCNRWCIVHVTCRNIIIRHMQALHIENPHQFDKAVYWKVMKEGWDRDPKWRCICAFFLAAAMEIDMVKRCTEERFKKVDSVGGNDNESGLDRRKYQEFMDIVRRIEQIHEETHNKVNAMHHDMDEIYRKVNELHQGKVDTRNNFNNQPSGYRARVSASSVHMMHDSASDSPFDVNTLFQKILEIVRSKPLQDFSRQSSSKNTSNESESISDIRADKRGMYTTVRRSSRPSSKPDRGGDDSDY